MDRAGCETTCRRRRTTSRCVGDFSASYFACAELSQYSCVIELGGTIGDIESMPFVEALRQLQFRVGDDNFCLVFVSLVPVMGRVQFYRGIFRLEVLF